VFCIGKFLKIEDFEGGITLYFGKYGISAGLLSKVGPLCTLPNKVMGARGGAVVVALRYIPEGRGIDFRWCDWNFSLT
jgi:hypothetical protein